MMTKNEIPVIVSIATIPSRIAKMKPALESLLAGNLVPDLILVNTPNFCKLENSGYDLPEFLTDAAQFGGQVRHVECSVDWGPGTKMLGAIPHLPAECILVIADDDVIYHKNFLQRMVASQMEHKSSAFSYSVYRAMGVSIATGCDGLSVWSPNLQGIQEFVDRHVAGTTLVYHDDIWISFFLMTKGVEVRQLPVPPDARLVYEQVLPNNVLAEQTGMLKRELITATHLPRLLKAVDIPRTVRVRVFGRSVIDGVAGFIRRGVRKAARLTGLQALTR